MNIQFHKIVKILEVELWVDFQLDESYTPKSIIIRAGTNFHDLEDLTTVELDEPSGTILIPLVTSDENGSNFVCANLVQIAVLSNHQNGRDTHVRQVRIFGPTEDSVPGMTFPSLDFAEFSCIR